MTGTDGARSPGRIRLSLNLKWAGQTLVTSNALSRSSRRPAAPVFATSLGMSVVLTVVQGCNLIVADARSSDPYVILRDFETGTVLGRTVTKKATLEPVWNQAFELTAHTTCVVADLFDEDTFSQDDSLGSLRIPIPPLDAGEVHDAWYQLTKGPPKLHGFVQIRLSLKPSAAAAAAAAGGGANPLVTDAFPERTAQRDQLFGAFPEGAFPNGEFMRFTVELVKRGGKEESALISGALLFTSHRIAFLQPTSGQMLAPVWVPLAAILEAKLEPFTCAETQGPLAALRLTLKDSRSLEFSLLRSEGRDADLRRVSQLEQIVKEIEWVTLENNFAFSSSRVVHPVAPESGGGAAASTASDGAALAAPARPPTLNALGKPPFDMRAELANMGLVEGGHSPWRVTTVRPPTLNALGKPPFGMRPSPAYAPLCSL